MNNDLDIAIVGMSGRFPGAANVDQFWRNLAEGVESITRLSDRDILESGVPREYLEKPNYVKAAPILDEPGHFDAGFFGFSPMEARTMDPQHRILLELAHEALENAGYDPDRYQGHIGVFTGSAMNTYFMSSGLNSRFAEDYIPTLIVNDKDFLSTRISYKLNLKGPSITIQTACSTSLVAIHLARQSLLTEETDMALAGAVSLRVPHQAGYFCDGGGVVSPDGRVRAFDATANGTVFGSGGGILVLKRLADAVAAGDTIHAVIKGSAVNNDGSEKAGYTAPSVNRQADLVVEALANAGVDAESIGYIEAHGSGTPLGDPIEIRALTKAFRSSTQRSGFCAIGSVKTNVGHLDAAAGVAGVIKTVLALEHRKLPASLNFSRPNPEIDFASTPFYVNTHLRSWSSDGPRRAGVMSTGMGGTNAHLVLEEAPEAAPMTDSTPPFLLILSAKTNTALDQATHRLGDFLIGHDMVSLDEVAYTLQVGRKAFPHRRYLVCSDRQDAVTALGEDNSKRVLSGRIDESVKRPVIFLFPGVGDHYVGMAHDLYERWDVFRQGVDRCSKILEPHLGIDIRSILYPDSKSWINQRPGSGVDLRRMLGRSAEALECQDTKTLNTTLYAQPALFTVEYALACLWQSLGITPDAIVGHSMGEYVAACLAGVLSLEDALRLITARAKLVNELPQGAMLAVMLTEAELRPLLSEQLSISLVNGPSVCVVAGPVAAVGEFRKALDEKGVLWRHVQNAHAFHSKMLDPIVKAFEEEVNKVSLSEPKIPYISNVTGTWITTAEATSPAYWATHTNHTARFSDALHELWQFKNAILVEAGPGRTLSVLATQHPDRRNAGSPVMVSSIGHHYESQPDSAFLLEGIGRLWLAGVDIEWEHLRPGGRGRRVALPTYPFERQRYWLDPVPELKAATPTQLSVQKNPDPSQWIYVPSWRRLLTKAVAIDDLRQKADGRWLVFADDCGFAGLLVARLKSAGREVLTVKAGKSFEQNDSHTFTIDPQDAQHYDSLIRILSEIRRLPDSIVHGWSLTGMPSDGPDAVRFAIAQDRGFYSLAFLAKAIAKQSIGHEIRLVALSNNIQDVQGTESLLAENSTLLGPCLVIPQEYPNIRTKSIDLDWSGDVQEGESIADAILGEFLAWDSELLVAYRHGWRWVQTYEPVALSHDRHNSLFRQGGVYLITGGLGNIGIVISKYLARNYSARLVLIGRSKVADRINAIESLRKLGAEVLYVNANVADASEVRGAVEQAFQRFGTLNGVIHGAGITGDSGYCEIKDCYQDNCDGHFQAKAHGLLVLEEVLAGKMLDFCLLLSSLTSVLGGIGQAAYAASNIFMDAFARNHNRSGQVPWLSVNWDVWRIREDREFDPGLGQTLKELGVTGDEAMEVMENVLPARAVGQLVVSTGDLTARINQWIKLESLAAGSRGRETTGTATELPGDDTERQVARIWQDALGIDEIGLDDNFSQLGGHSLLAIKIVAELRKTFKIDLPVRALFDAPTVAASSSYIKRLIMAEIEALSDDEAKRLVANE